jgi:molybdate transport system substrate-binding protein
MRAWSVAALLLAVAPAASAGTVRVYAASSLTDAFREMATTFERLHTGATVQMDFAGSQVLTTQVEQGAAADVFASADVAHAQALKRRGLLRGYTRFARNTIVLVVPARGGKVESLADVARAGLRVVVARQSVPVGRYTAELLAKVEGGFADRVRANVVSEETNVRAVLAKVALGEADAGFVYATDAATATGQVRTIPIPGHDAVMVEYSIGVLSAAQDPAAARAFVDLVLGEEGQRILRRYGFGR